MNPGNAFVLGTWGLSGAYQGRKGPLGYGSVSRETAFAVFDAAWAAGIRWVDTAPSYGGGEGYCRLAAWQANSGQRANLVFKPGRPLIDEQPVSRIKVEELLVEIEKAVAVLGYPSAILLKDPPQESFYSMNLLSVIDELAARFPLTQIGLASHRLTECAKLPPTVAPRIIQIEYHGINWLTTSPIIAKLSQKGWSVWTMQPLAYGFLGGRYDPKTVFPVDDWRSQIPERHRQMLAVTAKLFLDRLAALAPGIPPPVLSIAFCLTEPNVKRVVIGPKTKSQLDDALKAFNLSLMPTFRREVNMLRASLVELS